VRIGIPGNILGGEQVRSPEFATGVGLLHHGLNMRQAQSEGVLAKHLTASSIFERMKSWVKGYFI
jgi:cell division ATPase FtsA